MRIYYLGVRFTEETNQLLLNYRIINGLAAKMLPKLGFHTTIAYSLYPFEYLIAELPKRNIGIVGKNITLLGNSLVLPYKNCEYLCNIHTKLESNGASFDYQTYIPHITIAEGCADFANLDSFEEMLIPVFLSEIFYLEWDTRK